MHQGFDICSDDLGNYSVFSLQCFDGLCLITVVFTNGFDAVIKASKLELLMELDSKFVDLDVVGHGLGNHTLHLDANG